MAPLDASECVSDAESIWPLDEEVRGSIFESSILVFASRFFPVYVEWSRQWKAKYYCIPQVRASRLATQSPSLPALHC